MIFGYSSDGKFPIQVVIFSQTPFQPRLGFDSDERKDRRFCKVTVDMDIHGLFIAVDIVDTGLLLI